jgi:hypothetical protein
MVVMEGAIIKFKIALIMVLLAGIAVPAGAQCWTCCKRNTFPMLCPASQLATRNCFSPTWNLEPETWNLLPVF